MIRRVFAGPTGQDIGPVGPFLPFPLAVFVWRVSSGNRCSDPRMLCDFPNFWVLLPFLGGDPPIFLGGPGYPFRFFRDFLVFFWGCDPSSRGLVHTGCPMDLVGMGDPIWPWFNANGAISG